MKNYFTNNFNLNELINVFDELPLWSAPFGLKLLENINYKQNITALDIGFGAGFPLTEIAMRLGNGSVVYGIDPWKETFQRVYQKIYYYGINNVKLIEGVAESIPLENESVDLISSNNGINNVSDIDKALSECSRIIKSGGQFVQTMNLDKSMIEFYNQLENVLSEMQLYKEIELMHKHIKQKRPPLHDFIALMQKHNFIINDVVEDEFCYKFTDATAMFNHYFIRLAFMESWINLLPADKVELIFDTIESRPNDQAKEQSGIKLTIPFVLLNAIKK
ncbi:MAG: class I SAM-dependent methyltransferase [Ignavibacteria bacterium]|nr:class I SAM-dependent methyltransferase [Ignavibacteria bacterium]